MCTRIIEMECAYIYTKYMSCDVVYSQTQFAIFMAPYYILLEISEFHNLQGNVKQYKLLQVNFKNLLNVAILICFHSMEKRRPLMIRRIWLSFEIESKSLTGISGKNSNTCPPESNFISIFASGEQIYWNNFENWLSVY